MSANFLMLQNILAELKRVNSITDLKEYYKDEWEFYDLLMDLANDKNFKRACIDRSFSHDLKKDLDCYIRLANQAKKTASNYFRRKDVKLQAFYNDTNKVLNINLIHYNKNEPVRIGDILQQERDISALNIYCDKKHDIYVYRKGNKRHYEFEEGAYYEMTSTWSVQNKHGKTFTCTMVMNVSSVGIIEVLQFNGKGFELPSKKFWELIRQNEELYIQSLSLHDAVKALLEKNKNAPVVHDLQNNEHIIINQDKNLKDLENDAKDNPIPSFASNNVPAQQVAAQVIHPIATQTEVNLQHTETQTEVAVQHVETQTRIGFKQAKTQTKVDLQEVAIQTEVNSQQLDQKLTKAEQEIKGLNEQKNELRYRLDKTEQEIKRLNEQRNELRYRLDETEQEFKELEKHNSDLQDKFGEEKQKNAELQAEFTQKDEKLANMSTELLEKIQKLENMHEEKKDLKKKLEVANAEKRELISELRKLHKEFNQLKEEEYSFEDKLDQLKLYSDSTKKSSEQQISNLKRELLSLKEENQILSSYITRQMKSERELIEVKQKIGELNGQRNKLQYSLKEIIQEIEWLEKYNSDLQNKLREEKQRNAKLQTRLTQKDEKITNMSIELQELENAHEKKEDLKKKLKTANAELKKLKDKLEQFKEEREEVECILSEKWKDIANLKSQMQNLTSEYNIDLESYKQEVDQLKWGCKELKNEVELKDKQIKKHEQQSWQKIEETKEHEYYQLLESKIKRLEERNEHLKEMIENKALEIERITGEREELNDKVQYLNSQVEVLSPVSDQIFVNKKDACDNNSKMFYQLIGGIDGSEKKSNSDSAFYSDGDDDHCNSLLNYVSSPSQVCSQSQHGNV